MIRERTRRIPLRVAVCLRPPQGQTVRGHARDLSVSGTFLETRARLPVGTVCAVTLTLGEGHRTHDVHCEGTVVRADDAGMGIAFRVTDPEVTCELARQVLWASGPEPTGSRRG